MSSDRRIVTVGLNPSIDRVLRAAGFTIGKHQRATRVSRFAAGKAMNVTRALAVWGVPSRATGFVGRDELDQFSAAVERCGDAWESDFVAIDGRTRENITIVDPETRIETHLREAGSEVDEADLGRLEQRLGPVDGSGKIWAVFAGSLPPGLTAERFGELLDLCMERGYRVAVDSSGAALREALRRPVELVKPNLAELAEALALPAERLEFSDADRLVRRVWEKWGGPRRLLVSGGAAGACLFTRGSDVGVHGVLGVAEESLVSTVGCGDCLLGGCVGGLVEGVCDDQAVRRGVGTAAANAMRTGIADFDREAVLPLVSRTQIRSWTLRECSPNVSQND